MQPTGQNDQKTVTALRAVINHLTNERTELMIQIATQQAQMNDLLVDHQTQISDLQRQLLEVGKELTQRREEAVHANPDS